MTQNLFGFFETPQLVKRLGFSKQSLLLAGEAIENSVGVFHRMIEALNGESGLASIQSNDQRVVLTASLKQSTIIAKATKYR